MIIRLIRSIVRINRTVSKGLVKRFPSLFHGPSYLDELHRRIERDICQKQPCRVLEVGGIDRPMLPTSSRYQYIGLDIEERSDCYDVYDHFLVQSIEDPTGFKVDIVFSTTVLEHVENNEASMQSMFQSLASGGTTHHYVPSRWHPYAIALRLVGPTWQKRLIGILRPEAAGVTGFPAFFDFCSPSAMARLLERSGFVDIEVQPYYRANDYFAFFVPAFIAVSLFENACRFFDINVFASGFVVSAKKPKAVAAQSKDVAAA